MKLEVAAVGKAVTDLQFARYTTFLLPNGVTFEISEPAENTKPLMNAPVVSITVDDLALTQKEMQEKGVRFLTPILDSKDGTAWTYFNAPDGNVYQIQGPYNAKP